MQSWTTFHQALVRVYLNCSINSITLSLLAFSLFHFQTLVKEWHLESIVTKWNPLKLRVLLSLRIARKWWSKGAYVSTILLLTTIFFLNLGLLFCSFLVKENGEKRFAWDLWIYAWFNHSIKRFIYLLHGQSLNNIRGWKTVSLTNNRQQEVLLGIALRYWWNQEDNLAEEELGELCRSG